MNYHWAATLSCPSRPSELDAIEPILRGLGANVTHWHDYGTIPPEPPPEMVIYRRPPSMCGFHLSIGPHGDYMEVIQDLANRGRAISGAKVFKNGGGLETTTASDRSYVVFRSDAQYVFPNGKLDDYADNPPYDYTWNPEHTPEIAAGWMTGCWRIWQYNPAHFYELMNEPNPATELQMSNLIAFSRECMRLAREQYGGIKLAIGGFSSGTPPEHFIEMMSPLLEEMAEHGDILAAHDGAASPDIVLFQDAYENGSALRWRKWKQIQDSLGRLMPYVYSTETYCPEFYRQYGSGVRQADMEWYFGECGQDDYILGTALFELGDYNFGDESVNLQNALWTIHDIAAGLPIVGA